jgi:hypothetical protein
LTQDDVPYATASAGDLTPSSTDLLVFADTVTIAQDLINPGAAIQIFAREIVFSPGTLLDVSGTPAVTTWPADLPPLQPSTLPGVPGVAGANGNAGQIQLHADLFTLKDVGGGDPKNRTISLERALQRAVVVAVNT